MEPSHMYEHPTWSLALLEMQQKSLYKHNCKENEIEIKNAIFRL